MEQFRRYLMKDLQEEDEIQKDLRKVRYRCTKINNQLEIRHD